MTHPPFNFDADPQHDKTMRHANPDRAHSAGPALAQRVQAHALLTAEQARTQATALVLRHLQWALRRFEQALVCMSPPANRGRTHPPHAGAAATPSEVTTLQSLLHACNVLDQSLTKLIQDSPQVTGSRVLGADSGVAALRSRIRSTLLLNVDDLSLIHYGLQLSDLGLYGLDPEDCQAALAQFPTGLSKVLGSTGQASQKAESGLCEDVETLQDILQAWGIEARE